MFLSIQRFAKYTVGCALALMLLQAYGGAHAAGYKLLYNFKGGTADGGEPWGALVPDGRGGFYGTTWFGGGNACQLGCGAIYDITPAGDETLIYAFPGGKGGANPSSSLLKQKNGSFFGTTRAGGSSNNGTVFKLSKSGVVSVVYSFKGGNDGAAPFGLSSDRAGNLYGTTYFGGGTACNAGNGCGTVFKISPDGIETVLYAFAGGTDGANPQARLIVDEMGNLYGTTYFGGESQCGTVFKVAPNGTEQVLLTFNLQNENGCNPSSRLTMDNRGNLYGTAQFGGRGYGTVFKLAPLGCVTGETRCVTVLYSFLGGTDGSSPFGGLLLDDAGNFYSTTYYGGGSGRYGIHPAGGGTVFKIAPDGTETILHAFQGGSDGGSPIGDLITDKKGNLYGTTSAGGAGGAWGTVFTVKK